MDKETKFFNKVNKAYIEIYEESENEDVPKTVESVMKISKASMTNLVLKKINEVDLGENTE